MRLDSRRLVHRGVLKHLAANVLKSAMRDAVFAAATRNGYTNLIDPLPWFADGSVQVGTDGVHPTVEGHAALAAHIQEAIAPILAG